MKTHLFRPGEVITMCGIQIKSMSVRDPKKITCKKCISAYLGNEKWYHHVMASLSGPSGQWADVDTPLFFPSSVLFPNLAFDWKES